MNSGFVCGMGIVKPSALSAEEVLENWSCLPHPQPGEGGWVAERLGRSRCSPWVPWLRAVGGFRLEKSGLGGRDLISAIASLRAVRGQGTESGHSGDCRKQHWDGAGSKERERADRLWL